jgi:excisionase family DNA binding protein
MSAPITFNLPDELVERIAQRVADIIDERRVKRELPRWLTVAEAAAYIGAKPQRIYDLRSMGRLGRHGDGRRGLVDRNELDRLAEGGA